MKKIRDCHESLYKECNLFLAIDTVIIDNQEYKYLGTGQNTYGEDCVYYSVPNNKEHTAPYRKYITKEELDNSWCWILKNTALTKQQFEENIRRPNGGDWCTFKAICGIIRTLHGPNYAYDANLITLNV